MYFLQLQGLSLPASCLPSLLFDPEDGSITFVQNIAELQQDYTVLFIATAVKTSEPTALKYSPRRPNTFHDDGMQLSA
jgi:hypothetical protein